MKKKYFSYFQLLPILLVFVASCKKDSNQPTPSATTTGFVTLGLYEYSNVTGGVTNRRVFIPITQIGSVLTSYLSAFDTGSTGMTMDATGILPPSYITNNGFVIAGDSLVYNGITVTTQQAVISYGSVGGQIQEYGNLAYATVKIGDSNGSVTTGRIPFFLYYKVVDVTTGKNMAAHSNDVFGVAPGVSFTNNAIGSPLSYFKLSNNLTNGFKLALFNRSAFGASPTYVAGLLTIGLTSGDLSSSMFVMHPLIYNSQGGYSPNIAGTINYNGQSVPATILFDTGSPSVSVIENSAATSNITTLPANTNVTLTTSKGFS
ncbi:MAG: hypothetical protein JWR67_2812, partial [Mucilaginibacter sp.]|nr:hypothetical protein [Mucilaginibacter sp.]